MRFRPALCTYTHCSQRKKKKQKERNDYYYSFNLLNPKGTIHLLLKGDILTSYEHTLKLDFLFTDLSKNQDIRVCLLFILKLYLALLNFRPVRQLVKFYRYPIS